MTRIRRHCLIASALLVAVSGGTAAGDVTIYRCTDAQGRLTLRDTPCAKGERQRSREMRRPTDPAPRPPAAPRPVPPPAATASQRVVIVQAPRPLYECVNGDGGRYTSESDEGNPRWMPLAMLGYPVYPTTGGYGGQRYGYRGHLEYRDGPILGRVDIGQSRTLRYGYSPHDFPPHDFPPHDFPPHDPRPYPPSLGGDILYPAGTWIRDACHALPQQEVCSRLRDRRYELDRHYNSALQSERTGITTEQRGIDARLATDCGAY